MSIFQRPAWVVVFALTCAIVWGWAFPLLKVGFRAFGITPDMTGGKMLFAGIRFTVAGLILLLLARGSGRSFRTSKSGDWLFLIAFTLMNTTLHYFFFYVGMSHSLGSRAAILNSLGTFLVVLLACACFKSDRLTSRKLIGCIVGFCGILALNLGGADSGRFTWLGDGMIIINTTCSAIGGLMTRGLSRRIDVFVGTGYSLAIGGLLLIFPGLAIGGTLPHINFLGISCLLALITISALCFALYNKLLTLNPVGKVCIYNSLIPVVGAITSCFCLGETFYPKYVLAGGLAAIGIYIINKGRN
ncbi:MAG: DMT family transporter [Prevotella sp.]|nr:DMT family transporter [Prevotella sp.]